jgi:hypothetical protein
MVETLLAAMITALVATTGTTLIYAMTSAAEETRGTRSTKTAGHYALSRVARAIRSSRALGEVTPSAISVWWRDSDGDDEPNLAEMAVIDYDAALEQLRYTYLPTPDADAQNLIISQDDFKGVSTIATHLGNAGAETVVWAKNVEALTFAGFPENTDARIVEVCLTIGTGADETVFRTSASPRAPADYLFVPAATLDAASDPADGATRKQRLVVSTWEGLSTTANEL